MPAPVSGTITVRDPNQVPVVMVVTSTLIPAAGTSVLFTVYQGGAALVAGATQWPVPANFAFRPVGLQAVMNSSATTGSTYQVLMNIATSSASMTSASIATQAKVAFLQGIISAGPTTGSICLAGEVQAGTTVGIFCQGGNTQMIQQIVINGYLYNNELPNKADNSPGTVPHTLGA